MPFRNFSATHVFILLGMFWTMWLYTEITEYFERDVFVENVVSNLESVNSFMMKGGRFTHDDGDLLRASIKALESRVSRLEDEMLIIEKNHANRGVINL